MSARPRPVRYQSHALFFAWFTALVAANVFTIAYSLLARQPTDKLSGRQMTRYFTFVLASGNHLTDKNFTLVTFF